MPQCSEERRLVGHTEKYSVMWYWLGQFLGIYPKSFQSMPLQGWRTFVPRIFYPWTLILDFWSLEDFCSQTFVPRRTFDLRTVVPQRTFIPWPFLVPRTFVPRPPGNKSPGNKSPTRNENPLGNKSPFPLDGDQKSRNKSLKIKSTGNESPSAPLYNLSHINLIAE